MELGIAGHPTRGDEVIKLLESLGGKNSYSLTGCYDNQFYIMDNVIYSLYIGPDEIKGYEIFSLDEFTEKFPYKVGDKVNVWVNYDYFGRRAELEDAEIISMRWNSARCEIAYKMKDITREFYKDDIKGKVNDDEENLFYTTNEYEEIVEKSFQGGYEKCKLDIQLNGYELPEGYHFADGNGNVIDTTKILIKKNTPTYPTNYDECCQYLGCDDKIKMKLIGQFTRLINARNAYWKIAGEQLGLGKPWEPDWNDNNQPKFGIHNVQNDIRTINLRVLKNLILVFPTEEMRDTFYNNFKDLIEECKEML